MRGFHVGHAVTDATGRVLDCDWGYCELLGLEPEQLLGLTMQQITHPDDLTGNMIQFARLRLLGEPFDIRKRYIRHDGSLVWVENHVSRLLSRDGGIRICAFSTLIGDAELGGTAATIEAREAVSRARALIEQSRRLRASARRLRRANTG